MLPSDFSPEKLMRQRFFKREADMRQPLHEAKVKVTAEPFWTVEVQFDKNDFVDSPAAKKAAGMTGFPLEMNRSQSFYDIFLRVLSAGRFDIEDRFREKRMFIKVAAKSSKEAIKIINGFLVQARKVHGGAT